MNNYDEQLRSMDFYQLHPEYMPFIGEKYDEYKILHIGESHYFDQKYTSSPDKYPITYFDKWWNDSCAELSTEYEGWYDTRDVVANYLKGYRHKSHSIFSETIKVFDKVYLGREDVRINDEESQNYNYFAFMNFFQMPSLYNGMKYWNSLLRSAKKLGNEQLAFDMYEKAAKVSAEVLDGVIEILKPSVVLFTSKSAVSAYDEYGKYKSEPYVISSTHPGCAWWRKSIKKYNGLSGKEELERKLSELRNK